MSGLIGFHQCQFHYCKDDMHYFYDRNLSVILKLCSLFPRYRSSWNHNLFVKVAFKEENYKFAQIFIFKSMALLMISTYLITSHRFNHIKRPTKLIYYAQFYFYVNSKHIKLFFSNNFLLFFRQGIKIRLKYPLKKFFDVVQL